MTKQTHSFQAEVAQLLHLVTHSLYSNQEIFLRELISNASDACDKLRFEALGDASLYGDQPELEVRVSFDKAARTLTITDTGIGMSEDSLLRAFEPFYRADASRPNGTGLGLSIVRRLCDRFGWKIELESVLGQGTTATIRFLP